MHAGRPSVHLREAAVETEALLRGGGGQLAIPIFGQGGVERLCSFECRGGL